jgi:hypothetical protein
MMSDITITEEMIDEAVDLIKDTTKWPSSILDLMWLILDKFHISRCEGCNDSGRVPAWTKDELSYVNDLSRMHEELDDCPDCAPWSSHGWVIRKEKDDGMD